MGRICSSFAIVALTLGAQLGVPSELNAQGNMNRGRLLAEEHHCASCHSVDNPYTASVPYIDGQKIYYLAKQLTAFRNPGQSVPYSPLKANQRHHPTMKWLSEGLSDTDIRDVAEYFANLPCTPVRQVSLMTYEAPDKGQRCAYCHGATGVSSFDVMPMLGGQKRQYLIDQLIRLRDSALERPFDTDQDRFSVMMAPAVYDLSDKEIFEFADFYSRQSCKLPR